MSSDDPCHSALFTDLYQLTMGQAYDAEGMNEPAFFEMFYRELPECRNYTVAAGLESVLDYLETFQFRDDDLAFLKRHGDFSPRFLDRLKTLRFTGDVHAVPEGTIVFPNEPILQIEAPLLEAQLIETFLLNQMHVQTVAASKASRIITAAQGKMVIDFGSRRAHGADAAMLVARAAYLVGAAGTSNVLAGEVYGIPLFGTMAHAYIQAHDDEFQAFEAFANVFPKTTLLVDTYDTLEGVRKVIRLKEKLGTEFQVQAIRLDSGNLATLAKQSRQLLNDAGLTDVKIIVSSEMDEHKMSALLASGAPIDGFGVGTRMAVSQDAPDLDMAYKLVDYAGKPRVKLSSHKVIYPGRKQIYRQRDGDQLKRDIVCRHDEKYDGEPMLQPVMRKGQRLENSRVALDEIRRYVERERRCLPEDLLALQMAPPYPVDVSETLKTDLEKFRAQTQPT